MKIGLVGGSSVERSLPFNAERSVNLFPVLDQEGKEVAALYGTPGLGLFGTVGLGPVRGTYKAANGRAFVVSGSALYELSNAGTSTNLGTLNTSSGAVSIVENGLQLAVCDGSSLYILTFATNIFGKVTDPDLPVSGSVTFIDGYFVVNKANTGAFYISALYDGTSWDALDFATAESSPDGLSRVYNAIGQLWLFGTTTTEIWTNTGDSSFPFERIAGAKLETGIAAAQTAIAVDNTIFWVGQDIYGSCIVYRAKGFSPQRISTGPMELRLQAASDIPNMRAWTYQQEGHTFLVVTSGGLETSLVYDISTDVWHERAYLNQAGNFEQHLGCCAMFAFGSQLVGDRRNGNIYILSQDIYDDNGDPLCRERTYTHLTDELQRQRYSALVVGFEVGDGTQTGQGQNPQAGLEVSRNGARTWSKVLYKTIGAAGKYGTRVNWRRLGISRQITFRLRVTDPVKIAITGSYLE